MDERKELEHLFSLNNPLEEDEIRLNKDEIVRLWELGILSDLGYFFFVLRAELTHGWRHKLEDVEDNVFFPQKLELSGADIDYLMSKWRGVTPKNQEGDLKRLTADVILSSLAKMQKKDVAVPRSKQLTLFLGMEAPFTRSYREPSKSEEEPPAPVNLKVVRPDNEHLN